MRHCVMVVKIHRVNTRCLQGSAQDRCLLGLRRALEAPACDRAIPVAGREKTVLRACKAQETVSAFLAVFYKKMLRFLT